jgi:hypothetical protein
MCFYDDMRFLTPTHQLRSKNRQEGRCFQLRIDEKMYMLGVGTLHAGSNAAYFSDRAWVAQALASE